jgi:signal transduction histidine kinase
VIPHPEHPGLKILPGREPGFGLGLLRVCVVLVFAWLFPPCAAAGEDAPPLRVLILLGSDYTLPASVAEANAIRAALEAGSRRRVEFYTEALDANRMPLAEYEADYAGFMQRKYRGRQMDIVIAVQAAALNFAERHRAELWPGTPVVFSAMPAGWVRGRTFREGITGVTINVDPAGTLDLALRLQPEARQVVVVGGVGEVDRTLLADARQALYRYRGRLQMTWLDHHTLEQMTEAVGQLPADAIVLYTAVSRDAAGRVFTPRVVLAGLSRTSKAPLYGMFDTFLGHGMTGGKLQSFEADGRRAAALALRVLGGEPGAAAPVQPPAPAECRVDSRELHRFGLRVDRLPPGCSIEFRQPGLWEQHKQAIIFALLAILLQGVVIAALLVQRRLRHNAELAARQQLAELAHAARLATAGQLTAAIAHEINQPLSAILSNAEAAELMLAAVPPPIDEVRHILADIRNDDLRASEVIRRLRSLLSKHAPERESIDFNAMAEDVLRLLAVEADRRKVALLTDFHELPPVHGDRVQLQQALLNLILNGMDAMTDTPEAQRRITLHTAANEDGGVDVSVSDAGHGIPLERLPDIFESFTTSKQDGMGLGLSIARSIVEAHGGKIRAENNPDKGARFHFTLPADGKNSTRKPAEQKA